MFEVEIVESEAKQEFDDKRKARGQQRDGLRVGDELDEINEDGFEDDGEKARPEHFAIHQIESTEEKGGDIEVASGDFAVVVADVGVEEILFGLAIFHKFLWLIIFIVAYWESGGVVIFWIPCISYFFSNEYQFKFS